MILQIADFYLYNIKKMKPKVNGEETLTGKISVSMIKYIRYLTVYHSGRSPIYDLINCNGYRWNPGKGRNPGDRSGIYGGCGKTG